MMMETTVYSREFFFVQEMYRRGELGRLQFLRASHQQEMAGWPGYWEGLPPMHYATHCVGPVLALPDRRAAAVSCFGSGRIDESLIPKYGSPFAVESCHIQLKDSDLAAEITRSLFNTARQYRESFDVYGSKQSFEWTQIEHEDSILFTGEQPRRVKVPDYASRLPQEHSAIHHPRRLRFRRAPASVVHPRLGARRLASAFGARIRFGAGRGSRSAAKCGSIG